MFRLILSREYGRGLPPDLRATAQSFIYSSSSLELLPAIAPKPDHSSVCSNSRNALSSSSE